MLSEAQLEGLDEITGEFPCFRGEDIQPDIIRARLDRQDLPAVRPRNPLRRVNPVTGVGRTIRVSDIPESGGRFHLGNFLEMLEAS